MRSDLQPLAPKPAIRVCVSVPAGDMVKTDFAYDLARMIGATAYHRRDVQIQLAMQKSSILVLGRHRGVQTAAEADSTHILWLDSDMRFPKDTLVRLLAHDQPIVAASYVTRRLPVQPVTFAKAVIDPAARERLYTEPDAAGLVEVDATGMGCMLVKMEVFENTPDPWFLDEYANGLYTGEDVYFCRKAREHGYPVLIDQSLSQQIAHVGEFEYRHEHALALRDQAGPAA